MTLTALLSTQLSTSRHAWVPAAELHLPCRDVQTRCCLACACQQQIQALLPPSCASSSLNSLSSLDQGMHVGSQLQTAYVSRCWQQASACCSCSQGAAHTHTPRCLQGA